MSYREDLKKVMILYPELEVLGKNDYIDLINIHNVAESAFKSDLDLNLVKSAFENRKIMKLNNVNDYFYLIFKTAINNGSFKKFAYPNMQGFADADPEFDLEKWAGLVYKIYDAVSSGDMNLETAIDYYASTLNSDASEDEKFKKWIKYYQSGEHLKYSDEQLNKRAFQFPLNGIGFYPTEKPVLPEEFSIKKRLDAEEGANSYNEWKTKLYSAIRRLDKLLRQSDEYIDVDTQRELSELLHHFDQEVRGLRHEVTASDLAFRYANKLKKHGFMPGYQELIKYAQAVEPEVPELEPEEPAAELNEPESPEAAVTPEEEEKPTGGHPLERSFSGGSSAEEGEYEDLGGNVDLQDAVSKLEEIAGRLSDRRTIRLLAEFDIMLDKIGIAAMFPELAEAQSKLIDGYSYALTRVTKMLGMLASGKSLVEISDAKKKDLANKTMKEVNKTLEPEPETPERGTPAIQEGLKAPKPEEAEPKPETPEEVPT